MSVVLGETPTVFLFAAHAARSHRPQDGGRCVPGCDDGGEPFHEHLREGRCEQVLPCDEVAGPVPFSKAIERVNREDRFEAVCAADRGRDAPGPRHAAGTGATRTAEASVLPVPQGLRLAGAWPLAAERLTQRVEDAYRVVGATGRRGTLDVLA